jgi:hypothetical protein
MSKISNNAILLPSELERQQIFFLLKKESSWTAWSRILSYYKAWLGITEASVHEADKKGWSERTAIPESDYRLILKCFAHCDEGVRRLRLGDKRVFKYDANGEFVMAARMLSHSQQRLWRISDGDIVVDERHTPLWGEFKRAVTELNQAWGECSPDIIESQWLEEPAPNIYGVWFQENLPKMHFPETLQEVPNPDENVLVKTGSIIPCSGIWEPVDAPQPKGFSLFRNMSPPRGPFPLVGCMNYLHGDSTAPRAKQETETDSLRADVTWRLLWRDDRYIDGSIPVEEAGYVFRMPETPVPVSSEIVPSPEFRLVFADTGEPAPQGGRWLVEHDIHASINIQKGDVLPQYQGESVRWVLAETW